MGNVPKQKGRADIFVNQEWAGMSTEWITHQMMMSNRKTWKRFLESFASCMVLLGVEGLLISGADGMLVTAALQPLPSSTQYTSAGFIDNREVLNHIESQ